MLAHELRNPLAPIGTAASVIESRGPTDPQITWATGVIKRQTRQFARLVDDLMDVARVASGKITLGRNPAAGLRVLVVDDNVDGARTIAALLKLKGHEAHVAHDGAAALSAAAELQPHAVVLDIGLPGMDGYEVARRLRGQRETAHVLLIALTGYGSPEDALRIRSAGLDHHLVKPACADRLLALLDQQRLPAPPDP